MTMPSEPKTHTIRLKLVRTWSKRWFGKSLFDQTVYVQHFVNGAWENVPVVTEDRME